MSTSSIPRIFVAEPLSSGTTVELPAAASRHIQVVRRQPGESVLLFNGSDDAEWPAQIERIGRAGVVVRVGVPAPVHRELPWRVTLAIGVPANDRMDALVEKAGELGAAAIQPLLCERSVVRLAGERAEARRRHWRGVAAAASEQCGRTRVAEILPVASFGSWLVDAAGTGTRIVLSFDPAAVAPSLAFGERVTGARRGTAAGVIVLTGPEGGLTGDEEDAAAARGFVRVGLGPRVLRADTAPLALLAWLALQPSAFAC